MPEIPNEIFARDGEEPDPWSVASLTKSPSNGPFCELGSFIGSYAGPKLPFPSDLLHSPNFFKPPWHYSSHSPARPRRMKSTICMIEWIPSFNQLGKAESQYLVPEGESLSSLQLAFQSLKINPHSETLDPFDTIRFLKVMDVDVEK